MLPVNPTFTHCDVRKPKVYEEMRIGRMIYMVFMINAISCRLLSLFD